MILAVDAGNSRVKWGLHDGREWLVKGWVPTADISALLQQWATLTEPSRILISNVAGVDLRAEMERYSSRWPTKINWISASNEQCGVSNGYRKPAQLGCDRWAALIAAWKLCSSACVVVNAGTAMTVDALNGQGKFMGGMIVPGLTTMLRALTANTAGLEMVPGRYDDFPTSTADALYSGALAAMAGAVDKMVGSLGRETGTKPLCLLSGGDAPVLCQRLSADATIVDNLVLDGLIEIANQ